MGATGATARRGSRGNTIPPKKKKSKTNLVVDTIDVDEWESQEQRRLQSAFVVED